VLANLLLTRLIEIEEASPILDLYEWAPFMDQCVLCSLFRKPGSAGPVIVASMFHKPCANWISKNVSYNAKDLRRLDWA